MRQIGLQLVVDTSQVSKLSAAGSAVQRANAAVQADYSGLTSSVRQLDYSLNRLGITAAFVGSVGFRMMTRELGVLTSALGKLGSEFVNINEQFGTLQITLSSALRSFSTARDVVRELSNMTARSPLPFQDLARITQSLAMQPSTRANLIQQFSSGQGGSGRGYLQGATRLIEQMTVFRPDQGPESAIFALREAMGGQLRSLTRRFDIPSRLLSVIAQKSIKELTDDPDKMMDALQKLFNSIISPEAIASAARQPTLLRQNFMEQLIQRPLLQIGSAEMRTGGPGVKMDQSGRGPYQKMLLRLQDMYDDVVAFMANSFENNFAPKIRAALEDAFDRVMNSVSTAVAKVLDVANIPGKGAGIERLVTAATTGIVKLVEGIASLAEMFNRFNVVDRMLAVAKNLEWVLSAFVKFGSFLENFAPGLSLAMPLILSNLGTLVRASTQLGKIGLVSGYAAKEGIMTAFGRGPAPASYPLLAGTRVSGGALVAGTRGSIPTGLDLLMGRGGPGWGASTLADYTNNPIPAFLRPGGPATSRADYRTAFLNNPMLMAALSQDYVNRGLPASSGISAAALSQRIERERAKDIALIAQAPTRASILAQTQGGSRLVGLNLAAQGEAANLNRMIGGAAGGAIAGGARMLGGAALGMAGGMGLVYVVAKIIEVFYDLYTSIANVTDQIKENASALADLRLKLRNEVDNPTQQILRSFVGAPQLGASDAASRRVTGLEFFLSKASRTGGGGLAIPEFSNTEKLGMMMRGMLPGNTMQGAAQDAIFAKTGIDQSVMYGLTDMLREKGVLSGGQSRNISDMFQTDATRALALLFDALNQIPDAFTFLSGEIDHKKKKWIETTSSAMEAGLAEVFSDKEIDFLRQALGGQFSIKDEKDIAGRIFEAMGGGALRSRAESSKILSQSPLLSRYQEQVSTDYEKEFSSTVFERERANLQRKQKELLASTNNLPQLAGMTSSNSEKFVADLLGKTEQTLRLPNLRSDTREKLLKFRDGLLNVAEGEMLPTLLEGLKNEVQAAGMEIADSGAMRDLNILVLQGMMQSFVQDLAGMTLAQFKRRLGDLTARLGELGISTTGMPAFVPSGTGLPGQSEASQAAILGFLSGGPLSNLTRRNKVEGPVTSQAQDLLRRTFENTPETRAKLEFAALTARQDWFRQTRNTKTGFVTDGSSESGLFTSSISEAARREQTPIIAGESKMNELYRERAVVGKMLSELDENNVLHKQKIRELTKEVYELEVQMEQVRRSQRPESFVEGLKEGLSTAREDLNNFLQLGKDIGENIKSSFADAFTSIITGAAKAKDAFRDLASSITSYIAKMLMQKAVQMFFNWAIAAMGGPTGFFNTGGVVEKASGGFVSGGSGTRDDVPALLTGGEFVINKRAAQSIGYGTLHALNNGQMTGFASGGAVGGMNFSGGRPVNIQITVNNNASGSNTDTKVDEDMFKGLADSITELVDQRLMDHRRARGMLNPV